MIEIKEVIENFIKGKNAKYAVILCIGVMLLIAAPSLGGGASGGASEHGSALERRLTEILCEIEGVGDVSVMINAKNDTAEGVIVVARGAEHPAVKEKIYNAAIAALGVQPHKVEVFSKKKGD
ncbi:MAG: hypothetical protein LBH54_04770 [Clostridiales bacterium]|nr:hypothetical protein [Clostridiales bacterium]